MSQKRIHGNVVLQDISCTFLAGENLWLKRNQWFRKNDAHAFIVRFDSSVRGEIFYDEKKLGIDFRFPPSVGILLENPSFLDSCTGLQNLKMIADINQKLRKRK